MCNGLRGTLTVWEQYSLTVLYLLRHLIMVLSTVGIAGWIGKGNTSLAMEFTVGCNFKLKVLWLVLGLILASNGMNLLFEVYAFEIITQGSSSIYWQSWFRKSSVLISDTCSWIHHCHVWACNCLLVKWQLPISIKKQPCSAISSMLKYLRAYYGGN